MSTNPGARRSSRRIFLFGLGLLLVLGGTLVVRLMDPPLPPLSVLLYQSRGADDSEPVIPEPRRWNHGSPRPGEVPAPRPVTAEDLVFPSWSRPDDPDRAIRFQTDLDTIAPLGTGPENAALWFADFSPTGARPNEYEEAQKRAQAADLEGMLLPDEPLLLEAEPWVDQAIMRFYPDIWIPDWWETKIPNLMLMLDLSRSWAARGDTTEDLEGALIDYRRAIRLGRLARQADVTLIGDLVGLACIRIGLEGIYRRLIEAGDTDRALIVSLALGEHAPQRLKISEAITSVGFMRYLRPGWLNNELSMTDNAFHELTERAENDPDRRFRLEAIMTLNIVYFEGTRKQRRETAVLLARLAGSDDPWIAQFAEHARSTPFDLAQITVSQ